MKSLLLITLVFSFSLAFTIQASNSIATKPEVQKITADVTAQNDTICEGSWANIVASSTEAGTTFVWSNGDIGASLTVNPAATSIYTVTSTNPMGETASAEVTVVVYPNPSLTLEIAAETCEQANGSITAFADGGQVPYEYVWAIHGVGSNKLENLVSGNYSLTLTDAHGCATSADAFVPNIPSPQAGFSANPSVAILGAGAIQIIDLSVNAIDWEYNFGDGNSVSFPSPAYNYLYPGVYAITQIVYNSAGCSDTAIVSISVIEETTIFIPNAFSPNGDNKNDEFRPSGLALAPDRYLMQIFDRWGHLIFQTTDINQAWDGDVFGRKYNETSTEVFTYYISILDSKGENREYYGTLLRMP